MQAKEKEMMKRLILLFLLIPSLSFSQEFFFVFGKDTVIELKQNIKLCKLFESFFDTVKNKVTCSIKNFDGEEIVFIPTHVKLKKSKSYYLNQNHLIGYEYDVKKDEVTIIEENDSIIGKEFDFAKAKIKDMKYKNNENDHFKIKNPDWEKKIKDKEKKKLKIK